MKNLAIIEEGIVVNILLAEDDFTIENSIEYTDVNPAYIGGTYDGEYFYPPKPYPSWIAINGTWVSPVARPEGEDLIWSEQEGNWIESLAL
jgi:hypothetical protein